MRRTAVFVRARLDMPDVSPSQVPLSWLELQRFVSLDEAVRLSGLSRDTLLRRHSDKIKRISTRRLGIRLCDALMLTDPLHKEPMGGKL
jgi:hypothetical protein